MARPPHDDSHSAGQVLRPARSPSEQDLKAWAAAVAATLPPLTRSQVAAAARLAAHLDARTSQGPAA